MDVWLLPLGHSDVPTDFQTPKAMGKAQWDAVPTLDGHVVVRIPSGDGGKIIVYPFSQGGGPPAHDPIGGAPATGGSADGNLLVYFPDPADKTDQKGETDQKAGNVREEEGAQDGKTGEVKTGQVNEKPPELHMVTTRIPGEPLKWPEDGNEVVAAGGIYALTVNHPLSGSEVKEAEEAPTELEVEDAPDAPTLLLTFHWPEENGEPMVDLTPVVYRINESNEWASLVDYTYAPAGQNFVAMPLVKDSAGGLYAKPPTSEVYRIFWLRDRTLAEA